MIRYLAVIGTLAAFAGAPALAQQPTAPGQMMHSKGSVKGSTGASGYAPGHLVKKQRVAIKRHGASAYAPGRVESNVNTRTSRVTTGINTRSRVTTGSSVNTQSGMTTGSSVRSRGIDTAR
jgi:hypothetical protein